MSNISKIPSSVIITGAFRFPDKDAAAQRVLGIAKALRKENINTIFCGWETSPRLEDLNHNGNYKYADFEYYSQAELDLQSKSLIEKIRRSIFRGTKTIQWIKNNIDVNKINSIIIYNANSYFIYKLFKFSKKNNIKLVCDCTEWYEGSHLPGGRYGIVNFDNNIRIKILYPLIKNIIVISSYLENYLQKKGCNTLVIPPLVDLEDLKWGISTQDHNNSFNNKLNIIYAGDPGKKDLLRLVFTALEDINKDSTKIGFYILGVDKVHLKNSFFGEFKEFPSYIKCFGRVSQEKVPEYYHQCDFSILLRENKRYAHAGFPTKLVESLSSGIPIITNCTSDIPKYITNGENGFLLNNTSASELIKCFYQILSLSKDELKAMKLNAKRSSNENFDFRLFSNQLKSYFNNLK